MILLFDGACMLCNRFVRIPMRYAKDFVYVSTHSQKGIEICRTFGFSDRGHTDTIYIIDNHHLKGYKDKSDAVIQILKSCGGGYRVMGYFLMIFPKMFRDGVYAFVAKNRYRFKLKNSKAHCKLPKNINRSKVHL